MSKNQTNKFNLIFLLTKELMIKILDPIKKKVSNSLSKFYVHSLER